MGNPIVVPVQNAPPGYPSYYSYLSPINSDDVIISGTAADVAGRTDAVPPDGTIITYLVSYADVGGRAEAGQSILASTTATAVIDLGDKDGSGNELYTYSSTLTTDGLAPGLYVAESVIQFPYGSNTYYQTGGEYQQIVSIDPTDDQTTPVNLPATDAEISTDGRYLVYTAAFAISETPGDVYERDLQTGRELDLTALGISPVGTFAVNHFSSITGTFFSYPTFTSANGDYSYGTIHDFDLNEDGGGYNPIPVVTNTSSGDVSVLGHIGDEGYNVGAAIAASDNGDVVLTEEPYDVTYVDEASVGPFLIQPEIFVSYLDQAPTLTLDPVDGNNTITLEAGNTTLTGSSDAIGQTVEIDFGTPGDEVGTATVNSLGYWNYAFNPNDLPTNLTGSSSLYIEASVESAQGTPAEVSLTAQLVTLPAPNVTGISGELSDNSSRFYEFGPGETLTVFLDTSAPVTVTGTPELGLSNGEAAFYSGGSGTDELDFTYIPGIHDNGSTFLTVIGLLQPGAIDGSNGAALQGPFTANLYLSLQTTPDIIGLDPAAPNNSLASASDTPGIFVTAEVNETILIYDNGTVVGKGVTTGTDGLLGIVSTEIMVTLALPEGISTLSAAAVNAAGFSSAYSDPVEILVDSIPPAETIAALAVDGGNSLSIAEQAGLDITISGVLSTALQTGETLVVTLPEGDSIDLTLAAGAASFSQVLGSYSSAEFGVSGSISAAVQNIVGTDGAATKLSYTAATSRAITQISIDPLTASGLYPAISGNGSLVAFIGSPAYGGEDEGPRPSSTIVSGLYLYDVATGGITLAVASTAASSPAFSSDGSLLAYTQGDSVYLDNLVTGVTTLISAADDGSGAAADGFSDGANLSADGTELAFYGSADNLVPGFQAPGANGFNSQEQVYVATLSGGGVTGITAISASPSGVAGNNSSVQPSLSADGTEIAFTSGSTNLLSTALVSNQYQVYVKDLVANPVTGLQPGNILLVSANAAGAAGNYGGGNASLSANGRYVVFTSESTNLDPVNVPAGTTFTGTAEVYVKDLVTGDISLVSQTPAGVIGNSLADTAAISADGQTVVFGDYSSNLGGDEFGEQVYVAKLSGGTVTSLSLLSEPGGAPGNGESHYTGVSSNGSLTVFESDAGNLVPFPGSSGVAAGNSDDQIYLTSTAPGTQTVPTGPDIFSDNVAASSGSYPGHYLWSNAANWSQGVPETGAIAAMSGSGTDDITGLSLAALTLNPPASGPDTDLSVLAGLAVTQLTLGGASILDVLNIAGPNMVSIGSITTVAGTYPAGTDPIPQINAIGTQAFIEVGGAATAKLGYFAEGGGLIEIAGSTNAGSEMDFGDGTFALASPGSIIAATLAQVAAGNVLELPGTMVDGVTFGANSLIISTDKGSYDFTDVTYNGGGSYIGGLGYTASHDSRTGLEAISFTATDVFSDNVAASSGQYLWSNAANWSNGLPAAGDNVSLTGAGQDDIATLSLGRLVTGGEFTAVDGSLLAVSTLVTDSASGLEVDSDVAGGSAAVNVLIGTITGSGALFVAEGAGARLDVLVAAEPDEIYQAGGGGQIVLDTLSSGSKFAFSGNGTLALVTPGATTSAQIDAVALGDVIELPGSAVSNIRTTANALEVTISGNVYDFTNIHFGNSVTGYIAGTDPSTGLEAITFSSTGGVFFGQDVFSRNAADASGTYLWSNAANWSEGVPVDGAAVQMTVAGEDDIAGLSLLTLDLSSVLQLDADLSVSNLTLSSVAEIDVDAGDTLSLGLISHSGGDNVILDADGAGAVIDAAGGDNGPLQYLAQSGGEIIIAGAPDDSSLLQANGQDPAPADSGTIAFDAPGAVINAELYHVDGGEVLELPGTSLEAVSFGVSSLTITTNLGSYKFTNVEYVAPISGYTASHDAATGLEAISFMVPDVFNYNVAATSGAFAGDYLWSNAANWSDGVPADGAAVELDNVKGNDPSFDDIAALSLSSLGVFTGSLEIEGNLSVGNLTLGNGDAIDVQAGRTLSIGNIDRLAVSDVILVADGAGAVLDFSGSANGTFDYFAQNGGKIIIAGTVDGSLLVPNAYDAEPSEGGTIALEDPGAVINADLFNVESGEVLELPGTSLDNFSFNADSLTITTNLGSFDFTNVQYAGPIIAYTARYDAVTGLEAVSFTPIDVFSDVMASSGAYLWSNAANWGNGVPADGADVQIAAAGEDDIAGLSLSLLNVYGGTLAVDANLSVANLTLSGGFEIDVDSGDRLTIGNISGNVLDNDAFLEAVGAGAVIDVNGNPGTPLNYIVQGGGEIVIAGAVDAHATLRLNGNQLPGGGTIALESPGAVIAADLFDPAVGDVLELPGTAIDGIAFGISSLTITTDLGSYDFTNVQYVTPLGGYTASHDSATGLEAITFTSLGLDVFGGNNAASGNLWSKTANWSAGVPVSGDSVSLTGSGIDDIATLSLVSLVDSGQVTSVEASLLTVDALTVDSASGILALTGNAAATVSVIIGTITGSGALFDAAGENASLLILDAAEPDEVYQAGNGGRIVLDSLSAGSRFAYSGLGTLGLVLPGATTSALIDALTPGDVLELPGTAVIGVGFGLDSLNITTSSGIFDFTDVNYGSAINGYTAALDPGTGLQDITFDDTPPVVDTFQLGAKVSDGFLNGSYLWSDPSNWVGGQTPNNGDAVVVGVQGGVAIEDQGLSLSSLSLTEGGNTDLIGGRLDIGTVMNDGLLIALDNIIDGGGNGNVTITVGTISLTGSGGIYMADGPGAYLIDNSAVNPGGAFAAQGGGFVEITSAPGSASLNYSEPLFAFFNGPGTIALTHPGATIAASLGHVTPDDVLELPGTAVSAVHFGSDSLTISTSAGSYDFTDVEYDRPVTGYIASVDPGTGLEAVTFTGPPELDVFTSAEVQNTQIYEGEFWTDDANWSNGVPLNGDSVEVTAYTGPGPGAAPQFDNIPYLSISSLNVLDGAELLVASTLVAASLTIASGADVENQSLFIVEGAAVNDGDVTTDPSTIVFEGAVSGNGTIVISAGSEVTFNSSVAAGQTIDLATTGTLTLTDSEAFAGKIIGDGIVAGLTPILTAPATAAIGQGVPTAITGVSLAESGSTTNEIFTVKLSDGEGMLSATGEGVSGSGTPELTISGVLAEVNSALASLSDYDLAASDKISLSVTDGFGNTGAASIAVGIATAPDVFSQIIRGTDAQFHWSNAGNWSKGLPVDGDDVISTGFATDDIAGLTLSSLQIPASGNVVNELDVLAGLTIASLTITGGSVLNAEDLGTPSTVSIGGVTTVAGDGAAVLSASGAQAVIKDEGASEPAVDYYASTNGTVELTGKPNASSVLFFENIGTFALAAPGATIAAALDGIKLGDTLELPGSTVDKAVFGATSLTITTDKGSFDFSDVSYASFDGESVNTYTSSHDPVTGLEAINFIGPDIFEQNVRGTDAQFLWSNIGNWSDFVPVDGDPVIETGFGTDDVANLSLSSLLIPDSGNVVNQLDVDDGLTVGTLTIAGGAEIQSNDFGVASTLSIGKIVTLAGAGMAVISASGARAVIDDKGTGEPALDYYVSANGKIEIAGAPNAGSVLFYENIGTFALAAPGATIAAALDGIKLGDSLELPGSSVKSVVYGATSLTITTDKGSFDFSHVTYAQTDGAGVNTYSSGIDPVTGLETINFIGPDVFEQNVRGTDAQFLWSNLDNWSDLVPVDGDEVLSTGFATDDVANLSLSSLFIPASGNVVNELDVDDGLTVGVLTIAGSAEIQTNDFGTGSTLSIGKIVTIAGTGMAVISAAGARAVVVDTGASEPALNYYVSTNGKIELTGKPNAGSVLFYENLGTFALSAPGATIAAELDNVRPGEVLELPGSTVEDVVFGTSSLTITTNTGVYDFADVRYGTPSSMLSDQVFTDAGTGLQSISFTSLLTEEGNGFLTVAPPTGQTESLDQLIAGSGITQPIPLLLVDGPGTLVVTSDIAVENFGISEGVLVLDGVTLMTDPVTIDGGGDITGFGVITGSVDNAGSVTANGGALELTGSVGGSGTLIIDAGADLVLDNSVGAGQIVDFAADTGALTIGKLADFNAAIANFQSGDVIDLAGFGVGSATVLTLGANGVLSGMIGGETLNLTFSGAPAGEKFVLKDGSLTAAPSTVLTPVLTAPATAAITAGGAAAIAGVSLSETGSMTGETFTVTLRDHWSLLAATGSGITGAGSTALTISGSLAEVNADLATLTDTSGESTDKITLTATDSLGGTASPATILVTATYPLATAQAVIGARQIAGDLTLGDGSSEIIEANARSYNIVPEPGSAQIVLAGGTTTDTILEGGVEGVLGTANRSQINKGSYEIVQPGGISIGANIDNGGYQYVLAGGTAANTSIFGGGTMLVETGGTTSGVINFSNGDNAVLSVAGTVMPGAELSGFAANNGNAIILTGFTYAAADTASLGAAGVLTLDLSGQIEKLNFNPAQSNAGHSFSLTTNSLDQVVIIDPLTGTTPNMDFLAPATAAGSPDIVAQIISRNAALVADIQANNPASAAFQPALQSFAAIDTLDMAAAASNVATQSMTASVLSSFNKLTAAHTG